MSYQIVLIEPGGTSFSQAFRDALDQQIKDLGLDPSTTLAYFDASTAPRLDPKYPMAGIYVGSTHQTTEAANAVNTLLAASAFIIPVVTDLTRFEEQTPEALHRINGTEVNGHRPEDFDRLAALVLKALRLIREKRQVFISYLRRESRGVAFQLYYALRDRGFETFLDTYSIAPGLRFQLELWDRMNDSDLILLLDTENARGSQWVAEEIAQAKHMGLGIYQLIWPGVQRSRETDICHPHYLEDDAFEPSPTESDEAGPAAETPRLKKKALDDILARLERYRARSFSARRTRLVNAFRTQALQAGLVADLTQPDRMALVNAQGRTYEIFPVIGHLHSDQIHAATTTAAAHDARRLLYDDQGIRSERKEHLDWLNSHLSTAVQNLSLKDAPQWIQHVL